MFESSKLLASGRRAVAPRLYLGFIAASLAAALVSHRAVADWYGEYIGPSTCMPLNHISIGADGTVRAIHELGKLRTPEDFVSSLQRLGLDLKPQKTADGTKMQVYSATDDKDTFNFKFFTDQGACVADASLGLPTPPSASPKAQQPLATPSQPATSAPITTAPIPSPPAPQVAATPVPAKVWIIVVLLGNDPTGAPLLQFYLTRQDCLAHLEKTEDDPLIGNATGRGKFRLDCLQLTEADQKMAEPAPARSSTRRLSRTRHHPTQTRAAIQDANPSNNPPPSER
jgi:hypothetical protein